MVTPWSMILIIYGWSSNISMAACTDFLVFFQVLLPEDRNESHIMTCKP